MKDIKAYCEKEKVHKILRYAEACILLDYLILQVLWKSGLRVSESALNAGRLRAAQSSHQCDKREGQ